MNVRINAHRFPILFGLLLLIAAPAAAQKGAIAGVVVDTETGETLIGANVLIDGTMNGATTDFDGHYEIKGIDAGRYTVVFSYIGYSPVTVTDVEVIAGQTVRLDMTLSAETIGLDEVVVEARALKNTEASLLRERQKATAVSDAISAEAISRSGSGDAAGAMTKVTGASVVGGKYVYIRGLGERYSSTQLNGSSLPSADPDKQAFQLDLFPASLLDNIVTTKTFTPDKPGAFTGGLVNVGTKNFPDAFTLQFTTSSSYNDQSSLADNFISYDLGNLDWLGYDDGDRDIPAIFNDPNLVIPTEIEARFDPAKAELLDNVSRAFRPEMEPTVARAPVNSGFSMAFGNQIPLAGRPLGFTASLTYNRSTSFYNNGNAGRYELVGGTVQQIDQLTALRDLSDTRGSQEANWGGVATLAYKIHPKHELSATYLRTQNGTSDTRYLEGFWQDLSGNSTFQTRVLGYQERSLNSLQLKGQHAMGPMQAEWRASFSKNEQNEPDLRYFSNHYTVNGTDTTFQKPASLYPSPARFFRKLDEQNNEFGLDLTVPFRLAGLSSKVKFGGSYGDVSRAFSERRFEYRTGSGFSYGSFAGDNNAFFSSVGIIGTSTAGRPQFGNYITDASALKSNYTGDQTVAAGYLMTDLLLTRKLRFIGGVRLESTRMTTQSADTTLAVGRLSNDDVLPSVNLVYALTDNMNLRAAVTQTLARPTFRELAPYSTFDFVGDFVFSGSSTLKRTLITNYDLRWEWFTRPGEIIAVSGFYKAFENPIERVILTSVGNNSMSIQNVPTGRVVGAEFELRRRLDALVPALENVEIGGNLALVHSEVDIPEEELVVIRAADANPSTTRPLEGQSPYVVNVDLTYQKPEWGSVASIYYNLFGDRLRVVSEGAAPDIFERARGTVDFIYAQRIWRGVSLKFAVKNLTDSDALMSQSFKDVDYIYQKYESGRTYSLSFTYKVE
ncbi:MAG: TonB-dependent receptor [Rhodothermales bacterium]